MSQLENPIDRKFPTLKDSYNYELFFNELKNINYNGIISIEALVTSIEDDINNSDKFFNQYNNLSVI